MGTKKMALAVVVGAVMMLTGCQPTDEQRYFSALDDSHVPVTSMKYAVQMADTVCDLHAKKMTDDAIVAQEVRGDYTANTILALTAAQVRALVRAAETVYCSQ